jgi:hypothetical protein
MNVELGQINISTDAWKNSARIAGLLLVCFSEPLILLSYSARFLRVRRIFDAQNIYFNQGIRPSDMIKRYSEPTLTMLVLTILAVITGFYMILGCTVWSTVEKGYGIIPTFDIGFGSLNQHVFISLLFGVTVTMTEGALLALCLESIREIKSEFSMLKELCVFCAIWLTSINGVLFICI